MHVLDTARPLAGVAVYTAGYAGVVRHIGDPGNPRCATRMELDDVTGYGLGVALLHARGDGADGRVSGGDDWRGGYPAGHAAATMARSHASSIGFPGGRPIYFAVPDAAGVHEFALARDYLAGVADALGPELTGVYGSRDVVTMARGTGVATFYWQHRDTVASVDIHLAQLADTVVVGGVACGVSVTQSLDWGQHAPPGGIPSMVDAVVAAARHLSDSAVRRLATVYAGELARRRTDK